MLIKSFNNGGLKLPAIGQGLGAYKWDKSKIDVIRLGISLGMNLLDTAEEYDGGQSEEIIGEAVFGRREEVIIATKFSPSHSTYNEVLRAVDNSLVRLKTDYIDIYQMHWPNPQVPISETFRAIEHLLAVGKIRFAGACNLLGGELLDIQSKFSLPKIISLQSEYNLFDRYVEKEILPYCTENKMAFIAYSPLDKGRLSDDKEQKKLLEELSSKYAKTPSQVVLRWLISHESVVAIPKATTKEHVTQNAESADFDIEDSDIELISKVFKRPIEYIPANLIEVSAKGEGNRVTYYTLKEAIENKLDFVPSPKDLSLSVKTFLEIKPVRLARNPNFPGRYILVEGRIRFWAWIIAFGEEKPLPAYVRKEW